MARWGAITLLLIGLLPAGIGLGNALFLTGQAFPYFGLQDGLGVGIAIGWVVGLATASHRWPRPRWIWISLGLLLVGWIYVDILAQTAGHNAM